MSVSGAFTQGSWMAAWGEDRHYEEPDTEDEDDGDEDDKPPFGGWRYGPDPDEAHDRMMDDRMEREAEEAWQ